MELRFAAIHMPYGLTYFRDTVLSKASYYATDITKFRSHDEKQQFMCPSRKTEFTTERPFRNIGKQQRHAQVNPNNFYFSSLCMLIA